MMISGLINYIVKLALTLQSLRGLGVSLTMLFTRKSNDIQDSTIGISKAQCLLNLNLRPVLFLTSHMIVFQALFLQRQMFSIDSYSKTMSYKHHIDNLLYRLSSTARTSCTEGEWHIDGCVQLYRYSMKGKYGHSMRDMRDRQARIIFKWQYE